MSDVEPQPTSLEDISAGLLNGAMVTLLSGAFAGVVVWQIIAQLTGWLPDLKAMTGDLPSPDLTTASGNHATAIKDSLFGMVLLLPSLDFIQRGVRHVRMNLALLRARRG